MSTVKLSIPEEELMQSRANVEDVRMLWDGILDILLERVHHKSISIVELAHIAVEVDILLRAIKGKNGVWGSVIDVASQLIKKDVCPRELISELPYNASTIYRALERLELTGFAVRPLDGSRCWTINSEKCPVLYRATRHA